MIRTRGLFILLIVVGGAILVTNPSAVEDYSSHVPEFDFGTKSLKEIASEHTTEPEVDGFGDTDTTAPDPTVLTGGTTAPPEQDLNPEKIEDFIHKNINSIRENRGLSSLRYHEELESVADYHSKDMAKNDYFAHTSPSGETMVDRYQEFGIDCQNKGENIWTTKYHGHSFTNEEIAEKAVEGWMNSRGHRENILRDIWESEAIGVFIERENGYIKIYVTQNFC